MFRQRPKTHLDSLFLSCLPPHLPSLYFLLYICFPLSLYVPLYNLLIPSHSIDLSLLVSLSFLFSHLSLTVPSQMRAFIYNFFKRRLYFLQSFQQRNNGLFRQRGEKNKPLSQTGQQKNRADGLCAFFPLWLFPLLGFQAVLWLYHQERAPGLLITLKFLPCPLALWLGQETIILSPEAPPWISAAWPCCPLRCRSFVKIYKDGYRT